jgi:hypothetical protein
MNTTRRRLGMVLVVAAGLTLLLAQAAAAYTTGNALSAGKADPNNRAKLAITIVYDETSSAISGTAGGDWGVRVTSYRVKYTNLNSSYYVAYIDVDGTIHSLGHCGSGGGSVTWNSDNHLGSWRQPISGRPTSGVTYTCNTVSPFNAWHIFDGLGDYFTGYGKATGYIYNKSTGNAAGSVSVSIKYAH